MSRAPSVKALAALISAGAGKDEGGFDHWSRKQTAAPPPAVVAVDPVNVVHEGDEVSLVPSFIPSLLSSFPLLSSLSSLIPSILSLPDFACTLRICVYICVCVCVPVWRDSVGDLLKGKG